MEKKLKWGNSISKETNVVKGITFIICTKKQNNLYFLYTLLVSLLSCVWEYSARFNFQSVLPNCGAVFLTCFHSAWVSVLLSVNRHPQRQKQNENPQGHEFGVHKSCTHWLPTCSVSPPISICHCTVMRRAGREGVGGESVPSTRRNTWKSSKVDKGREREKRVTWEEFWEVKMTQQWLAVGGRGEWQVELGKGEAMPEAIQNTVRSWARAFLRGQ